MTVDIRALAALSRLEISPEEMTRLEKELPDIILFVEAIQKADISSVQTESLLRNVMREDSDPHERGLHSEALLKAAPATKGGRLVVKQVVSRAKKKR